MYRTPFGDQEYHHIYNRGAHKSELFKNTRDYSKFLSSIYHFNDINFSPENYEYKEPIDLTPAKEKRIEMVDIVAWCLMPNHYHLLLRQKTEKGITKFMRRLGTGYTMYTNIKYKHRGHIFEGPFKSKLVNHDSQLQHLTRYIHLNPLDLHDANWREQGVTDMKGGKNFILKYQWSSLNDYIGNSKFPQLLSPLVKEIIFTTNSKKYMKFVCEWMTKGLPDFFDVTGLE